jgi:hypothetical protein
MIASTRRTEPAHDPGKLSGPALRTFFNIARAWRLDKEQQRILLGAPSRATLFRWAKDPDSVTLPRDTLERISYLLGIYKALHLLFPDPEQADGWIHRPNSASTFNGQPALARMLAGSVADLYLVRRYLDGQRG